MIDNQSLIEGHGFSVTYDLLHTICGFSENVDEFHREFDSYIEKRKITKSYAYGILRYVLTGRKDTPSSRDLIQILGFSEVKKRIKSAMDLLDSKYDFAQLYNDKAH